MTRVSALTELPKGTRIAFGGDRLIAVPDEICERFVAGDAVVVVEATEQVLRIPKAERELVARVVGDACRAFEQVRSASDAARSSTTRCGTRSWPRTHAMSRTRSDAADRPRACARPPRCGAR